MLIVTGPTAVGKTDLVYQLARHVPIEIINADMGQMYLPLTIGTAKPAWRTSATPHHLFDILQEPVSWSVVEYREAVAQLVTAIRQRGALPVIVGGSGFYISSLLFSLSSPGSEVQLPPDIPISWEFLSSIDPVRAVAIHPHDTYRIQRALQVWYGTQQLPSTYAPHYNPLALPWQMVIVQRERQELYKRINERVPLMMGAGWLSEVESLLGTAWEEFLLSKKIIGYDDIIRYHNNKESIPLSAVIATIAQKTRLYAKRQNALFRSLERRLQREQQQERVATLTLTGDDFERYINRMISYVTESNLLS